MLRRAFIAAVLGQAATPWLIAAPATVQAACPVCSTVNTVKVTDVHWTERRKIGASLACDRCANLYVARNPFWASQGIE